MALASSLSIARGTGLEGDPWHCAQEPSADLVHLPVKSVPLAEFTLCPNTGPLCPVLGFQSDHSASLSSSGKVGRDVEQFSYCLSTFTWKQVRKEIEING